MKEKDLIITEADKAALKAGYTIDLRFGEYVIQWIEATCIFSTGIHAGNNFVLLPWQRLLIHRLFSWRNTQGKRRHKICSCWIPRGAGKTEFAAALTLYMTLGDGENDPSIIFAASSREQANLAFRSTSSFVFANPDLEKHLWVRDHWKKIEIKRSETYPVGGEIRLVSGHGKSKQGMRCSYACLDEIAEHTNRELYDAIRLSMSKRQEPILLTISTAGYDKTGIGYEVYSMAKAIIDGTVKNDFEFLPIVYENLTDDWTDIDTYKKCNPSWGHTTNPAFFKQLIIEAQNEPNKENSIQVFYLNRWLSTAKTWIPSQSWAACYDKNMKEADFKNSLNCVMGVDLSQRHDLTATTILIENNGHFYCFNRFWIPEESSIKKEQKDKVPYKLWQQREKNNLRYCDGNRIRQEDIKEQILKDIDFFGVREIRYDPSGAQLLMEQIEAETGIDVVAITQSRPSLSPATVELFNLIREGRLHHPDNDLLNWNVQNAVARPDNFDRILVEKGKCLQRVDGLVSLIIANSYFTNYKQDYAGIMC